VKELRSFGLIVGGIFAVIGLWPLLLRGEAVRLWALICAAVLLLPAVVYPIALRPARRVWMAMGHVLGWINTRIILGIVFYGLVAPMGMIMRAFGKDPMRRRFEPEAETYRLARESRPGTHMKHQF
jgi:hypothetical protein